MSITLTQPKTAADFARLPEGAPVQLIAGEFIMSPSPLFVHQKISMFLAKKLDDFVVDRDLGDVCAAPMDVHLSDQDVYQPDILFVSNANRNWIQPDGIYCAPDLVVEILSPSTAYYDLRVKKDVYEKYGVKEYWVVDPMEKSVEMFVNMNGKFETRFVGKKGKVNSIVLPEFSITTEDVFARG